MHRRSLVLRRFGPVDFGLGYFEDDAWIDHTTLADGGASLGIADGAFAAIHDLLECCRMTDVAAAELGAVGLRPIAFEAGALAATLADRREHVQPVARRSSAG
ncbi:MAG TPA: hypothetical protein VF365_11935 [Candidatus Limnocylindria bacterium]